MAEMSTEARLAVIETQMRSIAGGDGRPGILDRIEGDVREMRKDLNKRLEMIEANMEKKLAVTEKQVAGMKTVITLMLGSGVLSGGVAVTAMKLMAGIN